MAKRVSIYAAANVHKPRPLITIVSLECYEMRIPQEPVTAKGGCLSSCGPIDAYVSGGCDADGR
jgi:hypothetical protein